MLPVASAAAVIPSGMARGKFHGEMTAVTPRARSAARCARRAPAASGRAPVELDRPSRVVLEEVDRLADVRVGLRPRLAALADGERGELGAADAQVAGGAHEGARALLGGRARPGAQRVARGGDRAIGLGRRADRRGGDDPVGCRRVGGDELLAVAAVVPDPDRDPQRQAGVELPERVAQPPALRRPAQLEHRLVAEGREIGHAHEVKAGPRAPRSPRRRLVGGRKDSLAVFSSSRRTR